MEVRNVKQVDRTVEREKLFNPERATENLRLHVIG
jgi:hypothetical protein